MQRNLWTHIRNATLAWTTGIILVLVVGGGVSAFVLQMRADAINNATTNAGNLASVLAEQVEHALVSLDTSLRTTVRIINENPGADFHTRVTAETFVADLRSERVGLLSDALIGVADAKGIVISGSRGADAAHIDVADRDYFKALRDDPARGLYISDPLLNRVTGTWMIFLARRLSAPEGGFLGVTFVAVEPRKLLQTTNAVTELPGQSLTLQQKKGGLLVRLPKATTNTPLPGHIWLPY